MSCPVSPVSCFWQWAASWSTQATAMLPGSWPPGGWWEVTQRAASKQHTTPATLTQTRRSTGRPRDAWTWWRGGWRKSNLTRWREWRKRRRKKRHDVWCFSSANSHGENLTVIFHYSCRYSFMTIWSKGIITIIIIIVIAVCLHLYLTVDMKVICSVHTGAVATI